ncbi:uncharacterized protein KY384_003862 [Bacidia gigantensis]|uniref:uncharacterized protein n=1 Tax=Bacidia gigantensis TaxID=2732470 RepID=UPI001D03CECD|nr:uncharacterized protein KY384_003862 [Bacidia gigantensis]KAG8532221.1 hypothetical protein KY384_003862 [Bacidia gigantensis]
MTVRTTLKTKRRLPTRNTSNSDSDSEPLPPSDRRALAEAFGTKKARKRLQDQTENAISPSKSIRPNQPLDPLASAVLSTMPTSNPSRAKTAEEAASSKSIPKPNLSASSPSEAYPISTLVGNTDNLSNIRIQSLLDSVAASASVQINSHFLGPLLVKAAQARDIRACRLLKYTLLLIELYKIIITPPPGRPAKPHAPKRLPRLDTNVMKPLLEAYTGPLVDATAIRFTENAAGCGGNVTKWHLDLLVTHILALSLHVATPPFVVDTWLLQKDLVMDAPTIGTMFKELGCEVKAMGKSEMEGRKLSRAEGGLRRLVKLKVPLTFPGVKIGGGRRGMGR